jgi:threonine aldolase
MAARRGFGSDNHSGAHPAALEALSAASEGHEPAYGYDAFTEAADAEFCALLGDECTVHYTYNGTGANVAALASMTRPFDAVICPTGAHINIDECGAPERVAGVKLVPVETPSGKLTPALIEPHLTGFGFEHHAQPRVVSISQVSELGTVYTPDEVRALAEMIHPHGMLLHMDGARIANAAASLGVPLRQFTVDAGVDVVCFGGTKNGMVFGEAVIHFGEARDADFKYTRKQVGQLHSKMRFIAAQFSAMLEGDLWLETARHANAMATRLADGVAALGIEITQPVDANEVFAILAPDVCEAAQESYAFYVWDESTGEVRWVCSWDTTPEDVDGLLELLGRLVGG